MFTSVERILYKRSEEALVNFQVRIDEAKIELEREGHYEVESTLEFKAADLVCKITSKMSEAQVQDKITSLEHDRDMFVELLLAFKNNEEGPISKEEIPFVAKELKEFLINREPISTGPMQDVVDIFVRRGEVDPDQSDEKLAYEMLEKAVELFDKEEKLEEYENFAAWIENNAEEMEFSSTRYYVYDRLELDRNTPS